MAATRAPEPTSRGNGRAAPEDNAAARDIVVCGASAGGIEALSALVAGLPADFSGSVFVVVHVAPTATSVLPTILSRRGPLRAVHPRDGDPIERGVVYVAPPDHHLVLERGRMRITRGPAENGSRPALDPLFRSAAAAYGARVTGVVLSGNLDDGTAGLLAIKRCGGTAIVQDPNDAMFSSMPESAIGEVEVDHVVPAAAIAPLLVSIASERVDDAPCASPRLSFEVSMSEFESGVIATDERPGHPSGFTCPDCHGALWEMNDGQLVRYRCRVGHAFSPDTLLALESDEVENAIWVAYRALEENAALARRMQRRAVSREQLRIAERYGQHAAEIEARAALIRRVLLVRSDDPSMRPLDAASAHARTESSPEHVS